MIVSELIERLKAMPQDAIVIVGHELNETANLREVRSLDKLTVTRLRVFPDDYWYPWMDGYHGTDSYMPPIQAVNIGRSSSH